MSIYRRGNPQARVAPKAPWWRILRAWADFTLNRVRRRTERLHLISEVGPVAAKSARASGGTNTGTLAYLRSWKHVYLRRYTDEEIDRHLPKSLRKTQSTGPK
jgi:hypothetical protein